MRTLMREDAWVHYGQIYVESGDEAPDLPQSFGGQRNGLCGAACPGALFLITGLHTGSVGFTVELHDQEPPVDEAWEEIVEASFRPAGEVALVCWAGEHFWDLDLAGIDYRVRYCAVRMDDAHLADCRMDDEPEIDRYLLQFWPAPPRPDRIVKQTSQNAAYWHDYAQQQPPPPTAEEKAEAQRRARLKQEQAAGESRRRMEETRLPSDRLREVPSAANVAQLDRPLVDALAESGPAAQREIARWVTRRAYQEAQLTEIDWIAPALAAMDRGEPLPPPFDDDRQAWDRLLSDPQVPHTVVSDGTHDNCMQQAMAFPAVFCADEEDPLQAAVDTIWNCAVAFGAGNHGLLFSELRQKFPHLR